MMALRIVITGRVQGVGFRAAAQRMGTQLTLVGWVRNTPEGSVEMHAQGQAENVERFVLWCHRGPTAAHVEDVSVETTQPDLGLLGFVRR
jgi:acylphosphatase